MNYKKRGYTLIIQFYIISSEYFLKKTLGFRMDTNNYISLEQPSTSAEAGEEQIIYTIVHETATMSDESQSQLEIKELLGSWNLGHLSDLFICKSNYFFQLSIIA